MSISTSTSARSNGAALPHHSPRPPQAPTTLSATAGPTGAPDLTVHRITKTHHGRTLLMLGHAAEYLVDSRRFQATANDSDNEAIHILMGLSRSVFDDYANDVSKGRRLDRLVLGCVTKLLN
jgi:hypothetical protein